ncbi:DUF962 domain-containing protein [Pseudoalteromonas aurantia]|uniref:DUF962 domain-containing protein n=1 Tax=Pseudoalteromonas aurantia 208 TaxID=1314867 RepID=A0ABR9E880_9GAMM|nr:DUF962 domain-containing protein [Pseudoalteromonas aurantia]MBE0367199.1 hypothetical protein [Pseudoalteromonas aurantia 208]
MTKKTPSFNSFSDFYVFYLREHRQPACRGMHYIGCTCVIGLIITSCLMQSVSTLIFIPITGYGFAWFGHVVFEKNTPATFKYPIYSFIADWVMYYQWLFRKQRN